METKQDPGARLILRRCIQKVATGPEYSKDLEFEEARAAMKSILENGADPVQTAVFLIALRMKRETQEENRGVLQAIRESIDAVTAPVEQVVDIADPYDGFLRSLPVAPFLPAVLAACGVPAFSHGMERVGPKYGATHHTVLRAAGVDVGLSAQQAAAQLQDAGWAYLDQSRFCPALHDLAALRTRIVKRPLLTTVEVLSGPIRGRRSTHLITGYVHKAYPPVYLDLAQFAGFDSAAVVRGSEGGITPSLKQPARLHEVHDGGEAQMRELDPLAIGIRQASRGVPLPDDLPPAAEQGDEIAADVDVAALSQRAAAAGLEALHGAPGAARDCLIYGGAIVLTHLQKHASMQDAAAAAAARLDDGEALKRFQAALN